jgi:uncharacterized protein
MTSRRFQWRRLDEPGLEILRLSQRSDGSHFAQSNLILAGSDPFSVRYQWILDDQLRTRTLDLTVSAAQDRTLHIERTGTASWSIDGKARADLDGAEEVDLQVTPFCNTLAMRRFGPAPGGAGELVCAFVPFPDLSVVPSRQRYERLGPRQFQYIDLGASIGFEARLTVDDDGFIRHYEGLFEAIA